MLATRTDTPPGRVPHHSVPTFPPTADAVDAVDSLAPTQRVAPTRTLTPPAPRRRWRPRPALTEAMVGIAGFLTMVAALTGSTIGSTGGALVVAMVLSVLLPVAMAVAVLQGARRMTPRTQVTVASLSRLLCGLAACLAVGLSVGAVAFVVMSTATTNALSVLEPVLVASTYSLVTAAAAGLVSWRLGWRTAMG